jgi:hypothetical protein
MSVDREDGRESFLTRWSRVKAESREAPIAPSVPAPDVAADSAAEAPVPELPPVEELTLDSDFSGFFHPKVDEDLRRRALRKLFSDPHFNVMDGLDVYIDDYSKTEPIPAAMLASLKQAQRIFQWAAEDEAKSAAEQAERTSGESAAEPDLGARAALEASDGQDMAPETPESARADVLEHSRRVPPGTP